MKATEIFTEYHQFVEVVDEYLDKKEKAEKHKTSLYIHDMHTAERKLKIFIQQFRITNKTPKKQNPHFKQGGFKFLAM